MIFIYDKNTGGIKAFYQGDISQINNYDNPDWVEAWFPDDPNVINNPYDYKLIVHKGRAITYCKKPKLELRLNKNVIVGDGEDSASLTVVASEIHPLEEEKYKTILIRINEQEIEVENGETLTITSTDNHSVLLISGDTNEFRSSFAVLEVM